MSQYWEIKLFSISLVNTTESHAVKVETHGWNWSKVRNSPLSVVFLFRVLACGVTSLFLKNAWQHTRVKIFIPLCLRFGDRLPLICYMCVSGCSGSERTHLYVYMFVWVDMLVNGPISGREKLQLGLGWLFCLDSRCFSLKNRSLLAFVDFGFMIKCSCACFQYIPATEHAFVAWTAHFEL